MEKDHAYKVITNSAEITVLSFHSRMFQHVSLLPASTAASPSCNFSDHSSDSNLFHEPDVVPWVAKPALFANKVDIIVVNLFDIFV